MPFLLGKMRFLRKQAEGPEQDVFQRSGLSVRHRASVEAAGFGQANLRSRPSGTEAPQNGGQAGDKRERAGKSGELNEKRAYDFTRKPLDSHGSPRRT